MTDPPATIPSTPPRDISRVSFVSLGCPKNLVDSEKMLGTLIDSGFRLVNEDADADAIVINTCGFLEESKDESLAVIHDAIARKDRGELKRVVVAGCLVQRHRAKMLEWAPGIDAMIGVFDRDHIVDAVGGPPRREIALDAVDSDHPKYWIAGNALQAAKERGMQTIGLTVNGADGKGIGYFESDANRFRLTPRHWAYLRISEGCNQKCAFCTIPSIRGKMRSKPLDRIVEEARTLLADGAFEINLIGQDTTSYGYDIYRNNHDAAHETYSGDLIGLLTALNDVGREYGGAWMRLMYVYPTYFTDEMIDAIASLPNIVKYIDIPLQHMSDRMLSAMRRNITRAQQEELLWKLRERIPGLAIRTTFITGFPGETLDDHAQLLEFIDEFGFDMLGVFRYSREANTPAGTMDLDPGLHVPDEVKAAREEEIMLLQQEIAFSHMAAQAEARAQFDVLVDANATSAKPLPGDLPNAAHRAVGRAYFQAPQIDTVTHILSDRPLAPGELVRCTAIASDGYDLIARPTEELDRRINLTVVR